MAEFISVSTIKDSLTECPICTEQFDEGSRIPRRMPCCVQSICQPCLVTYSRGSQNMSCPLCRHQHHLPDGVKSLPREPLILKILDHLKIQRGLHLPCTDCPDKNNATAQCEECCILLCTECLNAHRRARSLRDHRTVSFEEMKDLPVESFRRLHACKDHQQMLQFYCYTCNKVICVSCTVVEHDKMNGHNVVAIEKAHKEKSSVIEDTLSELEEKEKKLKDLNKKLQKKKEDINCSTEKSKLCINKIFDKFMETIQLKRAELLSSIDEASVKELTETEEAMTSTQTLLSQVTSSTEYTRKMRAKADTIEDLQLMDHLTESFRDMQKEPLQGVKFTKVEVTVTEASLQNLTTSVENLGQVKIVTYHPREDMMFHDAIWSTENSANTQQMDIAVQKSEITSLLEKSLHLGDTWYLVDIRWFKQWEKFVGFHSCSSGQSNTYPGPVDNSPLLTVNGQLKEHLVDDLDYKLLPTEAWNKLFCWYGIVKNQNPIARKVIHQGFYVKHFMVEVYLLELNLCHSENQDTVIIKKFSRMDTIADLEQVMRMVFTVTDEKEVRLLNRSMNSTYEHLKKPTDTLEEAGLYQGQNIIIAVKNSDGTWPTFTRTKVLFKKQNKKKRTPHEKVRHLAILSKKGAC